jgi:DNA-binding response OmpR family regulator
MKHRILVVDDEQSLLEALTDFLSLAGYEVDGVQEAEAAQALLNHFNYSLVITDLALTAIGFAGLDVLSGIWDRSRRPKVIVLTGHDEPALRQAVQRWGADAYVCKPAPLKAIAATAATLLGDSNAAVTTRNVVYS